MYPGSDVCGDGTWLHAVQKRDLGAKYPRAKSGPRGEPFRSHVQHPTAWPNRSLAAASVGVELWPLNNMHMATISIILNRLVTKPGPGSAAIVLGIVLSSNLAGPNLAVIDL